MVDVRIGSAFTYGLYLCITRVSTIPNVLLALFPGPGSLWGPTAHVRVPRGRGEGEGGRNVFKHEKEIAG